MAKIDVKKLTPEIKKKYKAYNNALKLDLIKNAEKDRVKLSEPWFNAKRNKTTE